ncbi:hypothetical protein VNO78_12382 [Psophocarpus tetragonolobus]|uniref:Uncharacterized protein n=1 Tax=Psophocarpus tetragonolobus TaxID=3891 RepID=A0AAN9SQP0_PSOTE
MPSTCKTTSCQGGGDLYAKLVSLKYLVKTRYMVGAAEEPEMDRDSTLHFVSCNTTWQLSSEDQEVEHQVWMPGPCSEEECHDIQHASLLSFKNNSCALEASEDRGGIIHFIQVWSRKARHAVLCMSNAYQVNGTIHIEHISSMSHVNEMTYVGAEMGENQSNGSLLGDKKVQLQDVDIMVKDPIEAIFYDIWEDEGLVDITIGFEGEGRLSYAKITTKGRERDGGVKWH